MDQLVRDFDPQKRLIRGDLTKGMGDYKREALSSAILRRKQKQLKLKLGLESERSLTAEDRVREKVHDSEEKSYARGGFRTPQRTLP